MGGEESKRNSKTHIPNKNIEEIYTMFAQSNTVFLEIWKHKHSKHFKPSIKNIDSVL